jgi:hypothetical protein
MSPGRHGESWPIVFSENLKGKSPAIEQGFHNAGWQSSKLEAETAANRSHLSKYTSAKHQYRAGFRCDGSWAINGEGF